MLESSEKISCWIINGSTRSCVSEYQHPIALRPLPRDTPRATTFPLQFRRACHYPRGVRNASLKPGGHCLSDSPSAAHLAWAALGVIRYLLLWFGVLLWLPC